MGVGGSFMGDRARGADNLGSEQDRDNLRESDGSD